MDPAVVAVFIPVVALMIPITAIWTKHRQTIERMRLEAKNQKRAELDEVEKLRSEVKELKEIVYQQTLAIDSFLMEQRRLGGGASGGTETEVQQRLSINQESRG
ncbi:MAG TPA: hypothetical protein DER07_10135 [Armatimonadetes bacterium]|nr:hypothetical protein [Armatimonadota bacterium]